MLELGGATLDKFAAAYWSEQEVVRRLPQAQKILEALEGEGLVHRTINLGRHGPVWHLTGAGKAELE